MTTAEVLHHHLHSAVAPPSERRSEPLSPDLEGLLLACLAKDPGQRPASAAEVAEQLAACQTVPWSAADARSWWAARGGPLTAQRSSRAVRAGVSRTVVIDLAVRARETEPEPPLLSH
jgi:hypothetical protein